MSVLMASFLKDLIDATPCTEVTIVQDNCASPKDSLSAAPYLSYLDEKEDEIDSSCPELSRWDSTSSSLSLLRSSASDPSSEAHCRKGVASSAQNHPTCVSAQAKKSCPKPPRRKASWDGESGMDISISLSSDGTQSTMDMSTSINSQGENSIQSIPCPVSFRSDNTDRERVERAKATLTEPPRPPTRRTSSRLHRLIIRNAETKLDSFPKKAVPSERALTGKKAAWNQGDMPAIGISTKASLLDADDDDDEEDTVLVGTVYCR